MEVSGVLSQWAKGKKKNFATPLVLKPSTRWSVVNITLRPLYLLERTPVPTEQEDGLDQESVWTLQPGFEPCIVHFVA